jgi:opacity protein-like surface antigen
LISVFNKLSDIVLCIITTEDEKMKYQIKTMLLTSVTSFLLTGNVFANGNVPPMPEAKPEPVACVGCHCPSTAKYFKSGFYAGLQIGFNNMRTKLKANYVDSLGRSFPFSKSGSRGGFTGGLFLGARYLFSNCMIAGFELDGDMSTNDLKARLKAPARDLRARVQRRYSVIPAATLGFVFNHNKLVYAKAGAAFTTFRQRVYDTRTTDTFSKSKSILGFAPSVGFEYAYSSSMSARVEVGGEFYGKTSSRLVLTDKTVVRMKSNSRLLTAKFGVVVKI